MTVVDLTEVLLQLRKEGFSNSTTFLVASESTHVGASDFGRQLGSEIWV